VRSAEDARFLRAVGAEFQALRLDRGWGLRVTPERAGMSPSQLSKIERGSGPATTRSTFGGSPAAWASRRPPYSTWQSPGSSAGRPPNAGSVPSGGQLACSVDQETAGPAS
jgi:hypothetical protein